MPVVSLYLTKPIWNPFQNIAVAFLLRMHIVLREENNHTSESQVQD